MSPERWERISSLLNDVLEQPVQHRIDFLASACRDDTELRIEVESLLESHEQAGSFVPGPFGGDRAAILEQWASTEFAITESLTADPERIGPYQVECRLGEGGMGTVYRAVRADRAFEKRVAVKVLRADLSDTELVQRFRSERQILANLEHPNVARLMDGGQTDKGRPYLVMEYVEGRPVDRYCDEEKLTLTERLELFRKICSAVHVAHQNLIVHRDLKPANILVGDDGEPKLLDFGIAKLLQSGDFAETIAATAPGMSPMTLSYASPEQLQGRPVTTVSDVYSLGVVLFQLLAGRLPYDSANGRNLRHITVEICDVEPPMPSSVTAPGLQWRRQLTGDLDMIVLKALRKGAQDRYASAEQLASDVGRFLKGLPVLAQGDALRYRAGKFLRRHRRAVAAGLLIVFLTAGFIATLLVQRQQIQRKQRSSEEVARLMVDLFDNADPDRALGERLTARDLLERGARSMDGRLEGEPEVRATVLAALGQVHRKLGLLGESKPFLEETLELRRQTLSRHDPAITEALRELAYRDYLAGDYGRALERYTEALALIGNRQNPALAHTLRGLALVQRAEGNLEAAAGTFQRALEVAREALGSDDSEVAQILQGRAALEQQQGQLETAQKSFEQALAIYRLNYGERHPEVAGAMQNIAMVLVERELFEESDALFREILEMQRQLYAEAYPYPSLATTLDSLATSLVDRGRFEEAEPLAQEALAMRRQLYGEEHSKVARSINLLGLMRSLEGRSDEAETLLRQAVGMWLRLHGPDHNEITVGLANLGEHLVAQGQLEEGTQHLEEALRVSRNAYGAGHVEAAILSTTVGMARKRQGDLAGAEDLYRQALPVLESSFGQQHSRVATLHQNLGVVLRDAGRSAEAEKEIRQALESYLAIHGDGHYFVAITLKNLATVLRDQERYEEAEKAVRQALGIYAEVFPDEHSLVVAAREVLTSILENQKR